MSSSNERIKNAFQYALPLEGSKHRAQILEALKKNWGNNPEGDKLIKERFDLAVKTIDAQQNNGAGLPADVKLRSFHMEYNSRAIHHGIRTLPSSYNVLEAFFNYRQAENFFELLEEENFIMSFFDFTDFITSSDFDEKKVELKHTLVDDLIYHFDISNSLDEIIFSGDHDNNAVIGSISIVKRNQEAVVFLICGIEADLRKETDDFLNDIQDSFTTPGKEKIMPASEFKQGAVSLFGDDRYWETLAYCRFDLDSLTMDARYVQKDLGDRYITFTDELSIMFDAHGNLNEQVTDEYVHNAIQELEKFSHLFDIASKCLYLPYYFDYFDSQIISKEYPTKLAESIARPIFKKEKIVQSKYKIKARDVYTLERNAKPQGDSITFFNDEFKVEKSGFWKQLGYNSVGKDKSGNNIQGRTWVNKILSYYSTDKEPLKASFKSKKYSSENAGSVYLMRSAAHDKDIFKIGLTRRTSSQRANELSSSTSSPDKFLIAYEWETSDCVLAETLIHQKLESQRLTNRREFFKISYKEAMSIIQDIINLVNGDTNA